MAGINHGGQRPRGAKHLRNNAKKKRFKNDSEKQAIYHAKIAARREKRSKR